MHPVKQTPTAFHYRFVTFLPVLLVVLGLGWLTAIARYEALPWLTRWQALRPVLVLLFICLLQGACLGLTLRRLQRGWLRVEMLFWLSANILLLVGLRACDVSLLLNLPDWLGTAIFIGVGGAAGLTYCWSSDHPDKTSLWPLSLPFLGLAIVVSLNCDAGYQLIGLIVITGLADAVGRRASRILLGETSSSVREGHIDPLSMALGLGLLIAGFRIIGLAGGAGSVSILALIVFIGMMVHREIAQGCRAFYSAFRSSFPISPAYGFLYGTGLSLALVFWMSSLAPETGPDALGGRGALPLLWSRSGTINGVRDIALSYMGIGGEVLNLLGVPFAQENNSKLSSLVAGVMLSATLVGFSGRRNIFYALVAGLVFFSSTTVWWHFVHGFVDLPLAFFCVGSLGALVVWHSEPLRPLLAITAFLGGTAAAIKLNGGAILAAAIPYILAQSWRNHHRLGDVLKDVIWFAAGLAVALLPPVIRSALLTENPVFPFANSYFQSPLAEKALTARLYGAGLDLQTFLLPFETVLKPAAHGELGTYHPFAWLAALLSAGLLPWASSRARLAWGIAIVMWLVWVVTEQNLRYSMPAWACTAAAMALTVPCRKGDSLFGSIPVLPKAITIGAAGLLITSGIFINLARPSAWMWSNSAGPAFPIRLATGQESTADYLRLRLPGSTLANFLNSNNGTQYTVWQVPWMRDHLWYHGRTIAHPHGDPRVLSPLRDILPDRLAANSTATIGLTLKALGITHLIWDDGNPWVLNQSETNWSGLFSLGFSEQNLTMLAADRGLRLYRVTLDSAGTREQAKATPLRTPLAELSLKVVPGQLIGLEMEPTELMPNNAYVSLAWYSDNNSLLLYDRIALATTVPAGFQRRWQTVPPGAALLRILPSINPIPVRFYLLRPTQV